MTQTMHVVSHTHWDREWYRSFQVFRTRLVDVVDAVLNLLGSDPNYRYFHLDGQTIVLDDYLEIRPEREQQLKQYIREGRLLVGPWYTQPDEFLVSGEAMVRNLLLGRRMAHEFGACMDLGYLPDSFGHAGQMPQLFAGFGFPAAVLFRGITADQARAAFNWRGSDGTSLLTIKLPDDDAYSNFLYRLRATLADPAPIDYKRLDTELIRLRSDCESAAVCNQLLWMDGVDHIYPNPKTPSIIEYANQTLKDAVVVHSTLPAYVKALKDAAPDLDEQRGELRHANRAWVLQAVLANVASSHIEIKQANFESEVALERVVEPLCVVAWLQGTEYPRGYLKAAWKYLLQNHAHDSICGCSVDQVHCDMHYRFDQIRQVSGVLQSRALEALAYKVDTSFAGSGEIALLLYNPLPWSRDETVVADVPLSPEIAGHLSVYDSSGEIVPHQVLAVRDSAPLRQPRYDIPSVERRRIYTLALNANLLPFSFSAFRVVSVPKPQRPQGTLFTGARSMENMFMRVDVENDGTLTLTHKESGKVYRGLLALEDRGDGGEGWNWMPPRIDQIHYSPGSSVEIARVQDGPVMTALRVRIHFRVPAGFRGAPYEHDPNRMSRSEKMVDLPVEAIISLGARSRRLDIAMSLDNRARNHRLRVLFPTNIETSVSHADGAFDVVERSIRQPDSHDWREPQLGTYPHHSFVSVGDEAGGLAVLTAGTPEYEVIDEPRRTVAVTLLRAFGRGAGEPHEYIDSQELGTHTYRLALYPFVDSWEQAGVVRESRAFSIPLATWAGSGHTGAMVASHADLRVEGEGIDVTAVKLCDARDSLVLRLVNLSSVARPVKLGLATPPSAAYQLNLAEERQSSLDLADDDMVHVEVAPRQIVTVELIPTR
ncbi:MAG: glycosyl hydrolase-related protein [Chloroflexi bacterium]|nr:glycosyl hydrolase-related protein [Chloroflexota bacterium]